MSLSLASFKYKLFNDFGKPAKVSVLRIDTDVKPTEEQNDWPKGVDSATIFGPGMPNRNKFQRRF